MEEGTSFVCVTLVDIKGSTPRAQGGRMLVTASGLHSGTVGGGLVEAKALEVSQELEQLRFIEAGYRIQTVLTEHEHLSIDNPEDLDSVSLQIQSI